LTFELIHRNSWKGGSAVVLGLVLMDLVDWNGGVDNRWLDSLLLDDWLDVLMDVVVDMLASESLTSTCTVLDISNFTSVSELSLIGSETVLDVRVIAMLDFSVLYSSHVMCVLFGEDLLILDRLN
jgi:hypothetical protein